MALYPLHCAASLTHSSSSSGVVISGSAGLPREGKANPAPLHFCHGVVGKGGLFHPISVSLSKFLPLHALRGVLWDVTVAGLSYLEDEFCRLEQSSALYPCAPCPSLCFSGASPSCQGSLSSARGQPLLWYHMEFPASRVFLPLPFCLEFTAMSSK